MSAPEPPVNVSLPSPPNRRAAGSAPLLSSNEIVSFPTCPKIWIKLVLATVGTPPVIATAPPLTRIFPAAFREILIKLPRLSPNTVSRPAPALKLEIIAIFDPSSQKQQQEASTDSRFVAVQCFRRMS